MADKSILQEQVAYYRRALTSMTSGIHARGDTTGATSINYSGMQSWMLCDQHLSKRSRSASVLSLLAARDCGPHIWRKVPLI